MDKVVDMALDIKEFRENPKAIFFSEEKRGHGKTFAENVIKYDKIWRDSLQKLEGLKAERNKVSLEVNELKKTGHSATDKIEAMKKLVDELKALEKKTDESLEKREENRSQVGNIMHKSIPIGKDDSENKPVKFVGKPPKFDFPHKDHIEIGLDLDLFEFKIASEISGSRFVFFKNEAALLDLAIQKYAVDILVKEGFSMTWPPLMMNRAALAGGVNLSEFEDTIYKIEGEDLYLIGTSELPLVAMKKDQTLTEEDLPLKIGAISTCFRREAGSHGRDTKGTIRMHQFNKIEQVMYTKPEESYKYFKYMEELTEKMWKQMGIPFRVVLICTGDLGNKQALQNDIEAWFPGQKDKKGAYREVTSCSNTLTYQSSVLNTRYVDKKTGAREYVHMLNNTAIATSRAIPAILENFQQKDGSVKIPKVLWPYTGFKVIKRKKK